MTLNLHTRRPVRLKIIAMGASALLLMAGSTCAQTDAEASNKRSVSVVPRLSVTETFTDNVRLNEVTKQSDQTTEISAGLRMNIESPRLKTYFDYALTEIVYAHDEALKHNQNALTTFGTFDAIDNWALVDFSGTISQQAISAFGTQSISSNAINTNQAEVSVYRISPYVRGHLGGIGDYEARYSRQVTQTDAVGASGIATVDGTFKLTGGSNSKSLGWSADVGQQNVSYSTGRATEVSHAKIGLSYGIGPQFKMLAEIGVEQQDLENTERQNYGTNSLGLEWRPSEVTKLSATFGHRAFGEVHNLNFEHRSARTVWKFTDSKDLSTSFGQPTQANQGKNYDLLFAQFASVEPDPTARAVLVNNYLQSNGIGTGAVFNSFLTAAVSLQRRQELSFALLGVRDTIIVTSSRSESSRLDTLSTGQDDLANANLVRQQGLSLNYAHKLTPDYTLGVIVMQQKSSGLTALQDVNLSSFNANLTGKIGKSSSATVGARRIVFEGSALPYAETAFTGNLNLQF
jgi:uncharacterized protein (PEP-CTERM system associated)